MDAGVPARGLDGEAYRGHVFWDELFVLPYVTLHFPEVARSLLMYRHRRLPAARTAAQRCGLSGAMFPWQSGSSGVEETQSLHLSPRSGRWLRDHSHLQRHVGSAIAWNVWRYGQTTGDTGFAEGPGADLLLNRTSHGSTLSSLTFCYLGNRGIRVQLLPGRLGISVPASSPASPLPVCLAGERRAAVASAEERWFRLTGD